MDKLKTASAALLLAGLAACGGSTPDSTSATPRVVQANRLLSGGLQHDATLAAPAGSTTSIPPAAASRFLAQASFGPTPASIASVSTTGPGAWLDSQFTQPQTLHRSYLVQLATLIGAPIQHFQFYESFWKQAVTGNDQLRQRVAFALSEIFVVSMVETEVGARPYGAASYYDMLGQYAFGNFRDLLQAVALHPMMGGYLNHMHNQKEDGIRMPDENFARELMQLMTIGLYQLNPDGTIKTSGGKPIETYSNDDVEGLAKVFTGWSWAGPDQSSGRFFGRLVVDPSREWTPMQNYPAYHSTSDKRFLGVTITGATTGEADLKVALDRLFNHPNVGPFIGRQLIQRLVTSNPSPAYVGRVAAAFANNGSGVRGDMKAVLRAILLDPEAGVGGGAEKVREPVVRLANWMRAFNAKSVSGRFIVPRLDDPVSGLAQNPLRSPSVFNFFRPSYTPPNSSLSSAGLVSPEMQITGEPSIAGYLNFMLWVIQNGIGGDVLPDYTAELALADHPDQLVERINLLLLNGGMSSTLRNQLMAAHTAMPHALASVPSAVDKERHNRVWLTIFLAMASPEYLVQH